MLLETFPLKKLNRLATFLCLSKAEGGGGGHGTVESVLASFPEAPGLILGVPNFLKEKKNSMLVRFINSALTREWTVQS